MRSTNFPRPSLSVPCPDLEQTPKPWPGPRSKITSTPNARTRCGSDPTFALDAADADLIYDGTLIDLKATSKAGPVGRSELYQLLGYLLADSADHCGITHVGLSALRRRHRHIWEAQQFINLLTGAGALSLQQRREEFADLLAPMAAERAQIAQVRVPRRSTGLPDS